MLFGVFSIYDSCVSAWKPPMFFRNKGEVLRWFIDMVNNHPDSVLAKNPHDYCLFDLGTWNDEMCIFKLLDVPVKIGLAVEFIKAKENA